MALKRAPRLALCGNVFPADGLGEAVAALRGPVREWAARVRASGGPRRPGFGLYLAAGAAETVHHSREARAELRAALAGAGVAVWTANAFPYGGFHGERVKRAAFLPDWTDPRRLRYTEHAIAALAALAEPGVPLSLSTCPLGYGTASRADPAAREQLLRARDACDRAAADHGAPILLALEPEPDGAFERASELCAWLAGLEGERPPAERRLALCWDLCHGAVVGESAAEVLAALAASGTPLGKIQLSAALRVPGVVDARARARLAAFAADPYLHQVRALAADGKPGGWPDLPDFLATTEAGDWRHARVHCHVPIQAAEYGDGLCATDWRADLQAARAAAAAGRLAVFDAEVETYTLPVLPASARGEGGLAAVLAAETAAAAAALGLDGAGGFA